MPEWFCAIPARGGSERLPRKNLALLAGRPLIEHTIASALGTGRFSEVFVCTEDEEIASIATAAGACVPALVPGDLTGPLVASHVPCQWLHDELGSAAELLACLQPSSPLRTAEDISAGLDRFERGDVEFVVSVTPIDPHYFHWALHDDDGWRMFFGDDYLVERPLLPPVHRPNGAVKLARIGALRERGSFFGSPLGVVAMPEERSVHVATAFDLLVCEAVLATADAL